MSEGEEMSDHQHRYPTHDVPNFTNVAIYRWPRRRAPLAQLAAIVAIGCLAALTLHA